ncbi:DegT/DnrJ/EryC1/StrS family aminotransferase [Shimia abyssi]|uniref:dTDP-4-amino-4,6-dideoxygalactose transaminase n=1 Tax=Shimia abyssi TaxID=1662395 RepID=A0A2P8FBR2_9RHOB|nr:DegT/DnrJ/EryC1/StrS family aminotransferase [Shimia abyssi]PSL19138.1 dTDP-4-amino-4,6-dideoxygalactose transaminase [Shimia abyssi]
MIKGRSRFGSEEADLVTQALNSQDLWPYSYPSTTRPRSFMIEANRAVEEYFGSTSPDTAPFIVPTSSGTASIHVALGGLQVAAGSEVIVPPMTDMGTISPVIVNNNIPVFADVDPASGLITPQTVRDVITPRTGAVIAVHLTGTPVDIPGIRTMLTDIGRTDIMIIEDVAQGLGATLNGQPLGTLGDAGCFSLNSQKHISVGEGGFVLLQTEVNRLRCHSFSDKHRDRLGQGSDTEHGKYKGVGLSLRMSEIQGAMLLAQLPKLEDFAASRNAFGVELDRRLAQAGLTPQTHLPGAYPTFFFHMFATKNEYDRATRVAAVRAINQIVASDLGVRFSTSYSYKDQPMYKYDVFTNRNFSHNTQGIWPAELVAQTLYPNDVTNGFYDYTQVSCPNAESYLKRSFSLYFDERHQPAHATRVADAIIDVFNKHNIT